MLSHLLYVRCCLRACVCAPQFAVKIDKQDKRKDLRSGTVKAEVKVRTQSQAFENAGIAEFGN